LPAGVRRFSEFRIKSADAVPTAAFHTRNNAIYENFFSDQ
jgi:hypothetical protein